MAKNFIDPRRRHRHRPALTLIEMLISVTLTLLVVFAIVQVFEFLGDSVTLVRAQIDMAGQMRTVSNRLQLDLDNRTCAVKPWIDPASGQGYFEYIEGPIAGRSSDRDWNANGQIDSVAGERTDFGDIDDILAFTVRAPGQPFRGRVPDSGPAGFKMEASSEAEVIWWLAVLDSNQDGAHDANEPVLLMRRVLLVLPDWPIPPSVTAGDLVDFHLNYDLSVRPDPERRSDPPSPGDPVIANSLGDLTDRANRYAHEIDPEDKYMNGLNGFPHKIVIQPATPTPGPFVPRFITPTEMANWSRFVVLGDVRAFDVRVYDPEAVGYGTGNLAIVPGDPGYGSDYAIRDFEFKGAFVDLAYKDSSNPPGGLFAGGPDPADGAYGGGNIPAWEVVSYDTWSLGYERDGLDQNKNGLADEGFDGVDTDMLNPTNPNPNNLAYGVDDYGERETQPPYNVPLQGIEVRIRMMEPGTQQVRQVSVVGDFTDF